MFNKLVLYCLNRREDNAFKLELKIFRLIFSGLANLSLEK